MRIRIRTAEIAPTIFILFDVYPSTGNENQFLITRVPYKRIVNKTIGKDLGI